MLCCNNQQPTTNWQLPLGNFHGSVGSSPNVGVHGDKGGAVEGGTRPVDLFAVNSFENPPFAGCGNSADHDTPDGCGRLLVDGRQVEAAEVRYQADEVQRRSAPLPHSGGLLVSSATRMSFEDAGVMWQLNFSNPGEVPIVAQVEFELPFMVHEYAAMRWVLPLPYDPANFTYTILGGALRGE